MKKKIVNKFKQNILQHILESKQVRWMCYLIIKTIPNDIAPLYDKLRFFKAGFGYGMKTFLLCPKWYLLLNEEMVELVNFCASISTFRAKIYHWVTFYCREISNDVKDWLVDYEKSQEVDMEEEKQSKECKDLCHCAGPPEGFVMQVGDFLIS